MSDFQNGKYCLDCGASVDSTASKTVWVKCETVSCQHVHQYTGIRGCGVASQCPLCNRREVLHC